MTGGLDTPADGRWRILLIAWTAQTVFAGHYAAVQSLVPFMQDGLALTRAEAGLLASALNIGHMLLVLPCGMLTDRFAGRALVLVSACAISLVTLFIALPLPLGLLLLLLCGIGMGFSFIPPTMTRAVMTWFPPAERGTALGVQQTSYTIGGSVAALALPAAAVAVGWQKSFALMGVTSAAAGLFFFWFYREHGQAGGRPGAVPVRAELGRLATHLLRPGTTLHVLVGVIMGVQQFSLFTYLMLYLSEDLRFPVLNAAIAFSLLQCAGALGRLVWGFVSDRFFLQSRYAGLALLYTVTALLTSATLFLKAGTSPVGIWAVILLIGFHALAWNGSYFVAGIERAGVAASGVIAGLSFMAILLGSTIGPPLFGLVADRASFATAWMGLAALELAAAALALWLFATGPRAARGGTTKRLREAGGAKEEGV